MIASCDVNMVIEIAIVSQRLHVDCDGIEVSVIVPFSAVKQTDRPIYRQTDRPDEGLSMASAVLTIITALAFTATAFNAWIDR